LCFGLRSLWLSACRFWLALFRDRDFGKPGRSSEHNVHDVDGIIVKITSSKGTVADLQDAAILVAEGLGQELRELRLSDAGNVFKGANITIVKGTLGRCAVVNVGFINATGVDLVKITIDGDLGRILAATTKVSRRPRRS
jgi:hypothetical protein